MRSDLTSKLEQLRKKLTEGEEAFGPDSDGSVNSADAEDDAAGEGGADNVSPIDALVDEYIGSIVDSMLEEYDIEAEEATDFVLAVAEDLAEDGTLPPVPDYDDEANAAIWLGKAKSVVLHDLVLAAADAGAEEVGEE